MISSPIKIDFPRIVILGRPNVGKSTLFNRLLGHRRAITAAIPGVTRDAVENECKIDGIKVTLIDTGGFTLSKDELNKKILEKSMQVVESSDMILLLCDIHETTGEDQAFVELLRPYSDKIILVVNKVDARPHEASVYEKYAWGFKHVIGVSAEHGKNIEELKKLILSLLDLDKIKTSEPVEPEIRLAILGKPNTGKSTLLNRLLGEEKAIVSPKPGTTRDVIEGRFSYKNIPFKVLDTAGIRRKTKIQEDVEYYSVNRAIKSIEESDLVCIIIDAEEGLTEQDKKICSLAVKKGKGLIFVLNKWDLLKDLPNQLRAYQDRIHFFFPVLDYIPILPLSAKNGQGVEKLLDTAIRIGKMLQRRVDTPLLNKLIKDWNAQYAIPGKKERIKIRYATQVSANPLRFVFFLNTLHGYPQSYTQYLKNKIRKELGFPLVPFEIEIKSTRQKQK